jgi:hypothetical protein
MKKTSDLTHTPGPWVAEFTGPHATTRDGMWEIAPVGPDGQPDWDREVAATADTNEANARLIAAAPELLEALKAMMDGAYGNPAFPDENALVEAQAAAAIAPRPKDATWRRATKQPLSIVPSKPL